MERFNLKKLIIDVRIINSCVKSNRTSLLPITHCKLNCKEITDSETYWKKFRLYFSEKRNFSNEVTLIDKSEIFITVLTQLKAWI